MNEELIEKAKLIKNNAIADLTGYKVGAAVLTENNNIYEGVNVEDKVIPSLSVCAERNAIQNAITHSEKDFTKIAIVGGIDDKVDDTLVPCGVCLQYMLDLCPNIKIITYINGVICEKYIKDFINTPFVLE